MFLLRSAFWLILAFVVMSPRPVELGSAAGELASGAVAAGQGFVAQQLLSVPCDTMQCLGGKAVVAVTFATPAPEASAPGSTRAAPEAPLPRPRPHWMG